MAKKYARTGLGIERYVLNLFNPEDSILREIVARATKEGLPPIQVSPMDGRHLEVITRCAGVKKAVEIGSLAGYSGVCIARGLVKGGRLFSLECSQHHADVARKSFENAGLAEKVKLVVGAASETLRSISSEGPFDLVFIDADKESYPLYFKWAALHLKVGGILLAVNTFAFGKIDDSKSVDSEVKALRRFNQLAAEHKKFKVTILPTGEGLTLGIKIRK
jgi:caffeoyl-CoA O-methyltransferase